MTLEEDLDNLAAAVKRSRNKKLKTAFNRYINSLNQSLRNYINFLRFLVAYQNIELPFKQTEEWTHSFECRRTD